MTPGHGIVLERSERREARALGRASRAIDAGELAVARWELSLAGSDLDLAGYRALERARLEAAQGEFGAAADEARRFRIAVADPPLVESLAALEGDCLNALGQGGAARAAWQIALDSSRDPVLQRDLGLAIIQSLQREDQLDYALDPEILEQMKGWGYIK